MRTFPCILIHLRLSAPRPGRKRSSLTRGFTLVEMMVVVVVITLVATLAVPGVSARMRSNRTAEAAQQVAGIYRGAQLRAMGRGSAVLVRFTGGGFQVLEGIVGASSAPAGCGTLPASSCIEPLTRWDVGSDAFQSLDGLNFSDQTVTSSAGANLDVCFSPSGRTYSRTNTAVALAPMAAAIRFTVAGSGPNRAVTLSPTGAARAVAQ